ncbi:MAG: alginate lyase family protein [Verrucomicrobiae bacterium]
MEFALPADGLRAPKYVEFWMYLPARVPSGQLVVSINGHAALMFLQWLGWRRILTPIGAMGNDPDAKLEPGTLRLARNGSFPADFTLRYTDPKIVENPSGAGLSDLDLLDHVNVDLPEMSGVREEMAAGKPEAALKALASFFRKGLATRLPLPVPDNPAAPVESAKPILAGKLKAGGHNHTFPGGRIDWKLNPSEGKPNFTYEWGWSNNRQAWWPALAQAYAASKDDKYASFWAMQLRDWMEQCPAPAIEQEQGGSSWRGLEAGARQSRNWPVTFFTMAPSPGVSDADIILFLKSVVDHGNFLSGRRYRPGNHYMISMIGLYNLGVVFPELKDAAFWRQQGLDNLSLSLDRNTLADGAWYELSPGYHSWVVNLSMSAMEVAKNNGGTTPAEKAVVEKLQKLVEWNAILAAPDGAVPTVNDGGSVKVAGSTGKSAEIFPESALLRWFSGKPDMPQPLFTSIALRDCGYFVSRTGWGRGDSYVLFDTGPLGGWHGHQDALNIVGNFFGRSLLFDNGGGTYDKSDWRKYGLSSASHNTAMVDSLGQFRGFDADDHIGSNPKDTPAALFGTDDKVDYSSAWYVGDYGVKGQSKRIATHRREVAFIKPSGERGPLVVVVDTFAPLDQAPHKYEVRWHLKATQWKTAMQSRCLWTADPDQPNLAVLALDGAEEFHADSGVKTPELLGWNYPGHGGEPTPALTLRQSRTAAGLVRMVTVLVPFMGAVANPVEGVEPGKGSWTVTLKGQPPLMLEFNSAASENAPSFSIRDLPWPSIQ